MRTTIAIRSDLLDETKRGTLARRTTLNEFVADVLRMALSRPKTTDRVCHVRLTSFRGQGLRPGVNFDHSAELLDIMEGR